MFIKSIAYAQSSLPAASPFNLRIQNAADFHLAIKKSGAPGVFKLNFLEFI
jgi:hypothetical protein